MNAVSLTLFVSLGLFLIEVAAIAHCLEKKIPLGRFLKVIITAQIGTPAAFMIFVILPLAAFAPVHSGFKQHVPDLTVVGYIGLLILIEIILVCTAAICGITKFFVSPKKATHTNHNPSTQP